MRAERIQVHVERPRAAQVRRHDGVSVVRERKIAHEPRRADERLVRGGVDHGERDGVGLDELDVAEHEHAVAAVGERDVAHSRKRKRRRCAPGEPSNV